MKSLLGWWLFDPQRPAIMHATTRQTLIYGGGAAHQEQLGLTESANRKWLRFDYEDAETRYPVIVEWRNVPSPASGRPVVWRVDHVRSAAVWRQESGSASHVPSYGLWRRVDDCLTDALACWPTHALTGVRPALIALNGGWFNGAWTTGFYRRVSVAGRYAIPVQAFQTLVPAPLGLAAPRPWRRVEAATDAAPWICGLPVEIGRNIEQAMGRGPCLLSEDGERLLLGLPPYHYTVSKLHLQGRLFYADREFATDILTICADAQQGVPVWSVGREQNYLLFDRTTGQPMPRVAHTTTLPTGRSVQQAFLPHWVERRLGRACLEGLLSHPDMAWGPAAHRQSGAASPMPRQVSMAGCGLAGSMIPSVTNAVRALDDSPPARRNSIAILFDETNDGIARATAPFRSSGHWIFDPSRNCLINEVSEQKLIYCGGPRGAVRTRSGEITWRFRYEDRDVEYPLIVVARPAGGDGRLSYVWSVEHLRSVDLWRPETGTWAPPYGLWRRVDDCVLDALLCWPETDVTGQVPGEVVSVGGWCNGAWVPAFRQSRRRGEDCGFADGEPVAPFAEDLDAVALSWRYLDSEEVAGSADLAGVRDIGGGRYHLSAEATLTGFEQAMPHLRRCDGQAVMFPAGLNSSLFRGEDYDAGAFFEYADPDVLFRFGASYPLGSDLRGWWSFKTAHPQRLGLRHAAWFGQETGRAGEWFMQLKSAWGHALGAPSPKLWQRLRVALMDGWLAWTGTPRRLLDDKEKLASLRGRPNGDVPAHEKSGMSLARRSEVHVHGAYIGGRFNTTAVSKAWIEGSR